MIARYISIDCFSTSGREAHRLDDVEDLAGPLDRGVVLLLQQAVGVVRLDQADVRHRAIVTTAASARLLESAVRVPRHCGPVQFPCTEASMSGIVWIIYIAILVAVIAGWWMLFTKAGEAGWKSIIPIWNLLIILKIVGREWWWIILFLIPARRPRHLDHCLARSREELRSRHRVRHRPGVPRLHLRPDPRLRQRHLQGAGQRDDRLGRQGRSDPGRSCTAEARPDGRASVSSADLRPGQARPGSPRDRDRGRRLCPPRSSAPARRGAGSRT